MSNNDGMFPPNCPSVTRHSNPSPQNALTVKRLQGNDGCDGYLLNFLGLLARYSKKRLNNRFPLKIFGKRGNGVSFFV